MNEPVLGKLIEDPVAARDAIHIAIAPVTASEDLTAGQDVGFVNCGEVGPSPNPIGIVDPFLKTSVGRGERFYLFLYPKSITSLRHVWTHPAFTAAHRETTHE